MDKHGYLFFRVLVPADEVLAVRRDVLELCYAAGWFDQSYDLMQGVVNPDMPPTTEGKPEYMAVYRKVLKLPRFHNFPSTASAASTVPLATRLRFDTGARFRWRFSGVPRACRWEPCSPPPG